MKLSELRTTQVDDKTRVEVTVTWEQAQRPAQTLFAEIASEFAGGLALDYDAFVAACAVPAMHFGERRLAVDGDVCPKLADGLAFVMEILRQWYGSKNPVVGIDPQAGFKARYPVAKPRGGMLLSGGIDSLAMLRLNRRYYPLDHPDAIHDGFVIEGFDISGFVKHSKGSVDRARLALTAIAEDAGVTLIPIRTNLLEINRDVKFYVQQWHGGALPALTHLFGNRITRTYIASSYDASNLTPWGSHPLIDPYFSNSRLQVVHDNANLSRFEKTKCISDWDAALHNMRVCSKETSETVNCGHCEKCVRTMLALLVLGRLQNCRAFPARDISTAMLRGISFGSLYGLACYKDLVDPLVECGRNDLADVLRRKIHYYGPSIAFGKLNQSESLKHLDQTQKEILDVLPPNQSFVLIDDAAFDGREFNGHAALPFLHRDGTCEPPEEDVTAIEELERLCNSGANFVIFAAAAYWWLEYYQDFDRHLRSTFRCVLENERLTVFVRPSQTN